MTKVPIEDILDAQRVELEKKVEEKQRKKELLKMRGHFIERESEDIFS